MPYDPNQQYSQAIQGYQAAQQQFGSQSGVINKEYRDLYAQQAQYGDSQRLALQQQYQRSLASQQQSMLARGLGNTTVLDAGARGVNYDYANSLLTLNDQLLQRQNSIKQAQLGYQAGAQQYGAGLQTQLAGFEGGYANQLLSGQQQLAQVGLQGQLAAQQQGMQQSGQMQAAQMQQQNLQQNQAQQFGQQAALSNQQYQQQAALQGQQSQAQAAMQQAGFDQQNYASNNFGYYD